MRDAYVFLMNNFSSDDQVYLFGFSRGAYTVRVVASLLHMYGLLPKGNESLVPYAIRMMTADAKARFLLADEFKGTFSTPCQAPVCRGVGHCKFGWLGRQSAEGAVHS